jgi:hypothetical protein
MRAHPAPAFRLPDVGIAARGLRDWFGGHPGAVTMAGLLAIAAPLRFFIGALSVMQQPSRADVVELGLWWMLYAAVSWTCLLLAGQLGERLSAGAGRLAGTTVWLALACGCALAANLSTTGRARILIEQGVVQGVLPLQLYGFALSFTLASRSPSPWPCCTSPIWGAAGRTRGRRRGSPRPSGSSVRHAAAASRSTCRRCRRASIRGCCSACWRRCGLPMRTTRPGPSACSTN